jgi:hypothetical protein
MIAYHQSAYVVAYLIDHYSMEQFQRLWTEGIDNFEMIYGLSYADMKKKLAEDLITKYPEVPQIDWDTFKQGCMK